MENSINTCSHASRGNAVPFTQEPGWPGGALPFENTLTYTGREWDSEIGMYYLRARYYDPRPARFISEDPIWQTNLYMYVNNNPLMYVDPWGESGGASGSWKESNSEVVKTAAVFGLGFVPGVGDAMDIYDFGNDAYKLFSEPSWSQLGWTALSAGSLLPIVPNSKRFLNAAEETSSCLLKKGKKLVDSDVVTEIAEDSSLLIRKKGGRLGGKPHRDKVEEITKEIEGRGNKFKTEYKFDTPNGKKTCRYADCVEIDGDTNKVITIYQVVKPTKYVDMPKREFEAQIDIIGSPTYAGQPIIITPWNNFYKGE